MYLIGIDLGTSSVKTILIDLNGRVIAESSQDLPLSNPHPTWAEQNPEDWWTATTTALRDVLAKSNVRALDVQGIGFSGQQHGAVLLDKNNAVIRPAIIWCDMRAEEDCRRVASHLPADRVMELISNPVLPNFTAPKVLWVRRNEPENYERIHKITLPKDYLRYRLTGELRCEHSDASGTALHEVAAWRWSESMLYAMDIPVDWVPELAFSTDVVGAVTRQAAHETGLAAGTPVVAGAGDNAASAVGTGVVKPGKAVAIFGTSGVVLAHSERHVYEKHGRLQTFCHAIPKRYTVSGVTQMAGGSLRWFRDAFCLEERKMAEKKQMDAYELMDQRAAQSPPACGGLLFLPYLMGERNPHLDPNARGVFFGISSLHRKSHFIRAVLEGVTLAMRDSLDIMQGLCGDIESLRLTGGGSNSALWRNISANVFGLPVETLTVREGPAFGAALMAGVGAGVYADIPQAAESAVKVKESVLPDNQLERLYDERYMIFRQLYPSLQNLFNR